MTYLLQFLGDDGVWRNAVSKASQEIADRWVARAPHRRRAIPD